MPLNFILFGGDARFLTCSRAVWSYTEVQDKTSYCRRKTHFYAVWVDGNAQGHAPGGRLRERGIERNGKKCVARRVTHEKYKREPIVVWVFDA